MLKVLRNLFKQLGMNPSELPRQNTDTPFKSESSSPTVKDIPYLFADTETTGLNSDGTDEIVEIAIVDIHGNVVLNTLVRPSRKNSWTDAQAIHGISPHDVFNAPKLTDLLPTIASVCNNKTVVFFNAKFDINFFPKNFFPSVVCAMRCYIEACLGGLGSAKLMDIALKTGYTPNGPAHRALEDARACRHVWLHAITQEVDFQPVRCDSRIIAKLNTFTNGDVDLEFSEIFPLEMNFLSINDRCKFWTKVDGNDINVYRPRTLGGNGKIATLSKATNSALAQLLASDYDVVMRLIQKSHEYLIFDIEVTKSKKAVAVSALPDRSIALSPIDDEIYKCFIAAKSGMCDAIGTWEEFRKVETEISRVCEEHSGRYYKSKAKSAKFAIIFSPSSQTDKDIWSLQQEGYKVTSFDRALAKFGLEKMWDCKRYAIHVKEVQGNNQKRENPF